MYLIYLIYEAGLAVDWINDRVYWVEGPSNYIRVYDLKAKETSTVMFIEGPSTSNKLKILPHLGYVIILIILKVCLLIIHLLQNASGCSFGEIGTEMEYIEYQ